MIRRRLTRVEAAAAIGEREQVPCVCDGHDDLACDACGSSAEIAPEHQQDSAECWCGGDEIEMPACPRVGTNVGDVCVAQWRPRPAA